MQENENKYIYEEIEGKIVSVEESTEIQKKQKKIFLRVKLAALCASIVIGGIAFNEGKKLYDVNLTREEVLQSYLDDGISLEEAKNKLLSIEEQTANENDSLTVIEDFYVKDARSRNYSDEEIDDLVNELKSSYNDYQKIKKIVFYDKTNNNVVITDSYNIGDYYDDDNYWCLGCSQFDDVFVYRKEVRETTVNDNGEILNKGEWCKTSQYVFTAGRIPTPDVGTRYVLMAVSRSNLESKEYSDNDSSRENENYIIVEESRIDGEWYSSKPYVVSVNELPVSSEDKRYIFLGKANRDAIFMYEKQKRKVSTTNFEDYKIESNWESTGEYFYTNEPPVDTIDTRYVIVGYKSIKDDGNYLEKSNLKNSDYPEKSEVGTIINVENQDSNEQTSGKVR